MSPQLFRLYMIVSRSMCVSFRILQTAPSVFDFTAPSSPDRHREILDIFTRATGSSSPAKTNVDDGSLGSSLREAIVSFLDNLGGMPRGLTGVGYAEKDLDALVDGMLVSLGRAWFAARQSGGSLTGLIWNVDVLVQPQKRVVNLAPNIAEQETDARRDQLKGILQDSMRW